MNLTSPAETFRAESPANLETAAEFTCMLLHAWTKWETSNGTVRLMCLELSNWDCWRSLKNRNDLWISILESWWIWMCINMWNKLWRQGILCVSLWCQWLVMSRVHVLVTGLSVAAVMMAGGSRIAQLSVEVERRSGWINGLTRNRTLTVASVGFLLLLVIFYNLNWTFHSVLSNSRVFLCLNLTSE